MAPEAMERDEFTTAADVYSFGEEGERERRECVMYTVCTGMVMWEVATGEVPFASDLKQLSPVLLVMRLLMGHRPAFTASHNQSYKKIAESCWHGDPNRRPTFSTILSELRHLT